MAAVADGVTDAVEKFVTATRSACVRAGGERQEGGDLLGDDAFGESQLCLGIRVEIRERGGECRAPAIAGAEGPAGKILRGG